MGYRVLMGAATALLAATYAAPAAAQTTFWACRVPAVGVLYMIADGAANCLDGAHVKFSWTDGGAPGANSVTSAMIVDGTITAADVATDALTAASIANDAIGAAELAATAVTNSDLGSGTASATTFLRGDRTWGSVSPTVTQFIYAGGGSSGVATGTPTLLRTVGTFTKNSAGSAIVVSMSATVNNSSTTGGFCQFQLRVDDAPPTGNAATEYGGGVYANHQVLNSRVRWTGLGTGTHTVSIYLRGTNGNTCSEGYLGFDTEVLVEEIP